MRIIVCANDDPGVTLTYFTARSNLIILAFLLENGKTVDMIFQKLVYFCLHPIACWINFRQKLYLQHRLLFSDYNL